MYLKSLTITNFRKFGTINNKVEFVDASTNANHLGENAINIAPVTTLIVGKNNSGKTSVIKALEKLIKTKTFNATDFNFDYLTRLISSYRDKYKSKCFQKLEVPCLEFQLEVGLDEEITDLVTNIVPFMTLGDLNKSEFMIIARYEIQDEEIFRNDIKQIIKKSNESCSEFNKFLELIDNSDYKIIYKNANNKNIEFSLSQLIDLKPINANNIRNDKPLSVAFNKIISYRYSSLLKEEDRDQIETEILKINSTLTSQISSTHTNSINESLGVIESPEHLKMMLTSNLTFTKLLTDIIKYEYVEHNHNIPENQFGLGYTNLMMIIADLIDYMEKYPAQSFNSKINLISIEEPETFMHPQMQELFIKYINDTVSSLLKSRDKNVNSQLIISTHSSHVLNSKIHSGNTFNNINYITTDDNISNVVALNDTNIKPTSDQSEDDLKFLKKHIKYKVSELFFSDAIIFVEGITEETLLRYHIDNDEVLNKYYISIFNINGAHGLVYHNLIKLLKVPTLIVTDLDIKRTDEEKKNFEQISDLLNKTTTNKTIKKYNNNSDKLDEIEDFFSDDNLRIVFQKKINGFYSTSFEEAFILNNFDNKLLNDTLTKLKPRIYNDIVCHDDPIDYNKVKENSYKLQRKLNTNKSDFANELLYRYITLDDKTRIPKMPKYILDGLEWLKSKINKGDIK